MSRNRWTVATVAATVLVAGSTGQVAAHALGQTFPLPVPLSLYLAAAGITVAASFVISIFVVGMPRPFPQYPTWPVPRLLARVGSWFLRLLGLVWWYGAIAVGFVVGSVSPLPAVLFWIFVWVGVPITAVLLGNAWPSLSPFRTTHDLLERILRPFGVRRLDMGLANPDGIGRWPAVLLLLAFIWLELVFPGRTDAATLAVILAGYTAVTLLGMTLLGRVAWLREAEVFEVLFGWFGRVGPLGRRSVRRELCTDCGEACDPDHCVDCAECALAADGGDLRPEFRWWITGLSEPMQPDWSDAAFILLALAGVTFDGLKETSLGTSILNLLFDPLAAAFGPLGASLLAPTFMLIGLWLVFLGVFVLAVYVTGLLSRQPEFDLASSAGRYAVTLLPIASGYVIAHYLTFLLQGIVWLPELLANPLSTVAPTLDQIPIAAVWYLSVAAIVGGHIAAVVMAHRQALRDAPQRSVISGLPLVGAMVGYTVLSLWIIAQPIVVEPVSLLLRTLGGG
jgi:hypothetical protein